MTVHKNTSSNLSTLEMNVWPVNGAGVINSTYYLPDVARFTDIEKSNVTRTARRELLMVKKQTTLLVYVSIL